MDHEGFTFHEALNHIRINRCVSVSVSVPVSDLSKAQEILLHVEQMTRRSLCL